MKVSDSGSRSGSEQPSDVPKVEEFGRRHDGRENNTEEKVIRRSTQDTGTTSTCSGESFLTRVNQYASFVTNHANRGQESHFFCGSHFRGISHFLSSPVSLITPPPSESFPVVVAKDFTSSNPPSVKFENKGGLDRLQQWHSANSSAARIIFIRGYIAQDWITGLGSLYRIDTEFFRQKLHFIHDRDFYDLPSLPSNSANILHLNIPTVFKRKTALLRSEIEQLRRDEHRSARKYLRAIHIEGSSMLQRFSICDESTFTTEQDISILVANRRGRGWQATVWLDSGRDLCHDEDAPWQGLRKWHNFRNDPIPTVQHVSAKILASMPTCEDARARQSREILPQSAFNLPEQYGLTLDCQVAASDPLYAVSEVLFFYTSSETQFLNMLERILNDIMEDFHGRETLALDDLSYNSRLLATHALHIENLRAFFNDGVTRHWPLPQTRPPEALRTQALLADDLAHLARSVTSLASQTKAAMEYISSGVMLEESRKAIGKADRMHRLTLLAFFFLPLSFTTSLFGCNFTEFGTGRLSIWAFFVTLVPVTIVALVLCFWDDLSRISWKNFIKFRRK